MSKTQSATEEIISKLPLLVQESARLEVSSRNFTPVETRWLAALMLDNPLTPAPAAGAMVERVSRRPLGQALTVLEDALAALPDPQAGILPAERRMTGVILKSLRRRVDELIKSMQ